MSQLTAEEVALLDRYWKASNYLTVGQIYLQANPLLREPLRAEQVKPRLLGHWGTSPGLSLVYVHLNRLIRRTGARVLYIAGPGHGGPALVAQTYLEGTYSEIYPEIGQDVEGMRRLFRQFSTPGGIPSHVSPPTPGSIHEGGELGYALSHAFGAAFDDPDLLVACVIGDGEAETGPLEGAWKGIDFLNPARDGAVLPILHLNGYKIAGPTVLARWSDASLRSWLTGYGYEPLFVEGDDPALVHPAFAATLEYAHERILSIQADARRNGVRSKPAWPAIVLRTPKGWTGPKVVDGKQVEGTFRSHQVPLASGRDTVEHLHQLEEWLLSYEPEKQFDEAGRLRPELAALAPEGEKRMGALPQANGGVLTVALDLPHYSDYAIPVPARGAERHESTRQLGKLLRDVYTRNPRTFRLFCPDETNSNRLGNVFDVESRCFMGTLLPGDDHVSHDGRVMEVLSEHNCQGWLEGYLLTGRHGLFATYEAFAMVVASMATQHAKWLDACEELPWRAPVPSLNYLLTSTCWRNDHNGFSHQGPGFIDTILSKKGTVARVYLPPDANSLLAVSDHCLRSRNYVNLIVIDKQPQVQWLSIEEARAQFVAGASIWDWAGNGDDGDPDVVLAAAGDVVTMETVAAAEWLRKKAPGLKVRVVNVIDLMNLFTPDAHPHGMSAEAFEALFTRDTDVVFAFHGYPRAIHQLIHGRPNAGRFHVRGFVEEGTTTTPFDMVVVNEVSRYHLAMAALRRAKRPPENATALHDECQAMLWKHREYVVEHLEDMPEVRDWTYGR